MRRYFKLVCLHKDPLFLLREFRAGRARFGWSPPGTDLRKIKIKKIWTDEDKSSWRYTQFLLERISVGDRVVVQMEQPIEQFVIGEVIKPGYDIAPGRLKDFTHLLHVRPLSPKPIAVNMKDVTFTLKHDLSKRGHYYEIYPEESIRELDRLVDKASSRTLNFKAIRTDEDIRDRTLKAVKKEIARIVSGHWPTHSFEKFCELLCNSLEYVEVKERKDRHRGWDMKVRILNPLTEEIVLDDIPVQCKNYVGPVNDMKPIDDLARCIENTNGSLALLFILGELTDEFLGNLQKRQEALTRKLRREITLEVIDQDRIAELYVRYVNQRLGGQPAAYDVTRE
jgi:hypothetical protein